MKKLAQFIIAALMLNSAMAQNFAKPEYLMLVKKADSLYNAKDYKNSGFAYAAAFKAKGSQLALMEDRSALEHGKKQIYGSQIGRDASGKYFISPIEDEANVDKRRASVGLGPLAEYAQRWGIVYKGPGQ